MGQNKIERMAKMVFWGKIDFLATTIEFPLV